MSSMQIRQCSKHIPEYREQGSINTIVSDAVSETSERPLFIVLKKSGESINT